MTAEGLRLKLLYDLLRGIQTGKRLNTIAADSTVSRYIRFMKAAGWIQATPGRGTKYSLTPTGEHFMASLEAPLRAMKKAGPKTKETL